MKRNKTKDRNCLAEIIQAVNEPKQDTSEILDKTFQIPKKTVTWTLIDDTNPHYNCWKSSIGYIEAFAKYEDPNVVKPYGMASRSKSLSEEE